MSRIENPAGEAVQVIRGLVIFLLPRFMTFVGALAYLTFEQVVAFQTPGASTSARYSATALAFDQTLVTANHPKVTRSLRVFGGAYTLAPGHGRGSFRASGPRR